MTDDSLVGDDDKFLLATFSNASFQCTCSVKAKYEVNPSKAVIGVDPPVYTLS